MSNLAHKDPPPLSYDVRTFARISGMSRSWVHQAIVEKRLAASHAGGKLIIKADDAAAWLASLPPRTEETSRANSPRLRAQLRAAAQAQGGESR